MFAELQNNLQYLYALQGIPNIEQFLISARTFNSIMPGGDESRSQVLFREEQGEVSLAVHIKQDVFKRVLGKNGHEVAFNDFCEVVEEVSHFIYLYWRSSNNLPVSLLDVEVQGEIDKFILASTYFKNPKKIKEILFDHVEFKKRMDEKETCRYRKANQLGGRLITKKMMKDIHLKTQSAWLYLRSFYRLRTPRRLELIRHLS